MLHIDAEWHAACVQALFKQLNTMHFWDRGVTCKALGTLCVPYAFTLWDGLCMLCAAYLVIRKI